MIGVVLAMAACAAIAAGSARAGSTDWCGQAEGTCDTSLTYVQCSDGTAWVLDSTWSPDVFGEEFCDGGYSVLTPPAFTEQSDDSGNDQTSASDFSLASNMNPDPANYVTEVQCPSGQVWAVADSDSFVCPAA
jgi:hypothetical protein